MFRQPHTAILDAANKVILDRGADGFTLDAVAREATVSKGGLLYHFPIQKKLIEGHDRAHDRPGGLSSEPTS